jgi:hypothetical protein
LAPGNDGRPRGRLKCKKFVFETAHKKYSDGGSYAGEGKEGEVLISGKAGGIGGDFDKA